MNHIHLNSASHFIVEEIYLNCKADYITPLITTIQGFCTVYGIKLTSHFSSSNSPKQQCPHHLRSYFLYFLVFRIFLYCGFWGTFPHLLSTLWHPTPILLPGKSHRRRSRVGYSPWGRKESDTTERLHFLSLCQLY